MKYAQVGQLLFSKSLTLVDRLLAVKIASKSIRNFKKIPILYFKGKKAMAYNT